MPNKTGIDREYEKLYCLLHNNVTLVLLAIYETNNNVNVLDYYATSCAGIICTIYQPCQTKYDLQTTTEATPDDQ